MFHPVTKPRYFAAVTAAWLLLFAVIFSFAGNYAYTKAQSAEDVGVCTWAGCKSGAASFSIDDGNPICMADFEAAGFRGTYYYDGGQSLSWFQTFSNAGHEIGSHTFNHAATCTIPPPCFPNCTVESLALTPYTLAQVNDYRYNQLEPNIGAIEASTGKPVLSLAWPCGSTDAGRMTAASYYFTGSRGYLDPWDSNLVWVHDVNDITPYEWHNVHASYAWEQNFIDRAVQEGKWAIITSHEVCAGISYMGSRSEALYLAPVGEVMKYIRVRDAAEIYNYQRVGSTIQFNAVHTLPVFERQKLDGSFFLPIVYDNPVTLKARLLESDNVTGVTVNGAPTSYTIKTLQGSRYVLVDTPLDTPRSVAIFLDGAQQPTEPPTATATTEFTPTVTVTPPFTATPTLTSTVGPSPTFTATTAPTATFTATATTAPTATFTATTAPTATFTATTQPTPIPGETFSLWSTSATPAVAALNDPRAVELGVQFRATQNGYITGIRFYKGATNNGTHTGHLWSSAGVQLAEVIFSNETASGWQSAYFSQPVSITAGTTYVASYHTTSGNYSTTSNYFINAYSNGPLYAFASSGVTGGNGVYRYGTSAFPNQTYNATNYWVDVIFAPLGGSTATPTATTAPSATATRTPTATATTAPTATFTATAVNTPTRTPTATNTPTNAPTATFTATATNTPTNAPTATNTPTATFTATATNTPTTAPTATFTATAVNTPTNAPTATFTATATNTPTNAPTATFTATATFTPTATATPTATPTAPSTVIYSIWSESAVPNTMERDSRAVELGVQFQSDVSGYITGIRFYKSTSNTGTHLGHLWTANGTMLGEVTFTNETASGWQTATFSQPIAIQANTTYVASYHTTTGFFSVSRNSLRTGYSNPPLRALPGNQVSPGNGVYRYGASAFPDQAYNNTNYWVDVLFVTSIP